MSGRIHGNGMGGFACTASLSFQAPGAYLTTVSWYQSEVLCSVRSRLLSLIHLSTLFSNLSKHGSVTAVRCIARELERARAHHVYRGPMEHGTVRALTSSTRSTLTSPTSNVRNTLSARTVSTRSSAERECS